MNGNMFVEGLSIMNFDSEVEKPIKKSPEILNQDIPSLFVLINIIYYFLILI